MKTTKGTTPITYRVSREVASSLKKLARAQGSVEKVLRSFLFEGETQRKLIEVERLAAAERFKPGDYARLGKHPCRVVQNEGFGLLRVILLEDQLVVSANATDISKPEDSEIMAWKLEGK